MENKYVELFLQLKNESQISWLKNPGVQTVITYMGHVWTPVSFKFKDDPFAKTNKNEFMPAEMPDWAGGDGIVSSEGPLFAAFKWAEEFNSRLPGAKPVKVMQVCSSYNRKSVYDGRDKESRRVILENGYVGAPCMCEKTASKLKPEEKQNYKGDECCHSGILNDSDFFPIFQDIVSADVRIEKDISKATILRMSNDEIIRLRNTCPIIRAPLD
eukprot:TRINITY_DN2567_c0_g6_i1.p1 TRINITY_DN2567_c0_g6~~TRINITY_DN2567_c0_g6_i1.p1  ORF type:complete len:214 (+),score=48.21 TRINITY_DN2567_c0_g6_i1:108-749(+)